MSKSDTILLGHGSGGKLSHDLIDSIFVKYFDNQYLRQQTDSAILNAEGKKLAFTTDSFVVDPIFFPGGNIGKSLLLAKDIMVTGSKMPVVNYNKSFKEALKIMNNKNLGIVVIAKNNPATPQRDSSRGMSKSHCAYVIVSDHG